MDPHDLCAAKLSVIRSKDTIFVGALLEHRPVNPAAITSRLLTCIAWIRGFTPCWPGTENLDSVHMGSMSNLQTILDLRAAATDGPQSVEVIDDHSGRPEGRTWIIPDVIREKYGRNAVSFGEDEGTARFVAAAFTAVPELTARLQKIDELVSRMEAMLGSTAPDGADFEWYAAELREALDKDVPRDRLPLG